MHITIDRQTHATVVSVAGSIDALTADTLTAALRDEVRAGHTRIVAALGEVDYTSSAGLRVLLAILKEARQHGGDLRLAAVQEKVYRILDLSGFTSIIKCYPDVPAALESFTL